MNKSLQSTIDYLVESGWNEDQAKNLIQAIYYKDKNKLIDISQEWIEHCADSKFYVEGMLTSIAMGLVDVTKNNNGEWEFSMNKKGLTAATQIQSQLKKAH